MTGPDNIQVFQGEPAAFFDFAIVVYRSPEYQTVFLAFP
jgi:hypothetical protein